MSFKQLFDSHAEFYRDEYIPYLIEEGFIDRPEDSEFSNGVEAGKPIDAKSAEGSERWPASLRELLGEVGSCLVHYPTAGGPVPMFVMDAEDIGGWSSSRSKSLPSYLEEAGQPAKPDAVPFLTDEAGAFVAYLESKTDERVYVVSDEGKHRGPAASLHEFFSAVFENARNRRMPFDGMGGDDGDETTEA
jgi:hypothetical protein